MTLRVVMRTIDPALPRIGTDFMTRRVVMRTIDSALPRIGTDFMTPRVVMRKRKADADVETLAETRSCCFVAQRVEPYP